jgi:hypothetical protein
MLIYRARVIPWPRMRRMFAGTCCVGWLIFFAHCSNCCSSEPSNASFIEDIRSAWDRWDKAISSFEVEGYKFLGVFKSSDNGFSAADVEAWVYEQLAPLLERSLASVEIEMLTSLTLPIFRERVSEDRKTPEGSWRPFSFVQDGGKARVDDVLLGNVITTIRDEGQELQHWAGMRQADIRPATTPYGMEDRNCFFYRMAANVESLDATDWRITRLTDGLTSIEGPGFRTRLDTANGFVSRDSVWRANGVKVRERFQILPVLTAVNVPVARGIVQVHYFPETGCARLFVVYVVSAVDVNRELDETRFQLAVPADTTIFNRSMVDQTRSEREGRTVYRSQRVTEPGADAKAFAEQPGFGVRHAMAQSRPESIGWAWIRRSLIIGNAFLLSLIVAFIFLRQTRWAR